MKPVRRLPKSDIPMALQAEQAMLGAVLGDASGVNQADQMLRLLEREEQLFDPRHRDVYRTVQWLREHGQSADLISVRQRLLDTDRLDAIGGDGYLAELCAENVSFDVTPQVRIIREKAQLRALMELGQSLINRVTEGEEVGEIVDAAYAAVGRVSEEGLNSAERWLGDVIPEVQALVERWHDHHECTGVPTGFSKLDEITAGLQAGDLIVIASRPGVGKSSLAMDIVTHAAMRGHVCGVFSAEMTRQQLALRAVCTRARVDSQRLRRGRATPVEQREFKSAGNSMRGLKVLIDDTPMERVSAVRAKARLWKRRHGLSLIVVDYLQLFTPPKDTGKRHVDVGAISSILKATAKELGVPVLALCQLNRKPDERQGEPRMADLRESGNIEQDADIVALMWRPSEFGKEEDEHITLLEIEKHRNGPTGTIALWWMAELTHFTDPPHDWHPSGAKADSNKQQRKAEEPLEAEDDQVALEDI